ncbi:unnamed protein product [Ilex paraguariensis]
MAVGKKYGSYGGRGLGLVRCTSFGRKRVALFNDVDSDSTFATPTKKQCCENSFLSSEKSLLEALPQDVLIRVLCGVEHEDLKRLFHVSKFIKETALMAEKWHFTYSTPRKTLSCRDSIYLEDVSDFNEVEAPNAPKQSKVPRSRLDGKKLTDISVALFASPDGDRSPRRELFMGMETER